MIKRTNSVTSSFNTQELLSPCDLFFSLGSEQVLVLFRACSSSKSKIFEHVPLSEALSFEHFNQLLFAARHIHKHTVYLCVAHSKLLANLAQLSLQPPEHSLFVWRSLHTSEPELLQIYLNRLCRVLSNCNLNLVQVKLLLEELLIIISKI